ncbi:uricase [Athelia psychrophila]|uniref:Uricase n=1 Tax=Athelia psychrophila TaxID=1759441 RepID=A0A167UD65_9AGAM|nr:uricase [Fibularhizoctonia sp. CBS 109695]KZP28545.1 uricase [Fibularhizoctonia sp. CBS 109695]
MSSTSEVSAARYGKDKIRVFRIVREANIQHVVEYNVCALLEGDIDTSYTQADNSVIVATDSIKNITYFFAKTSPHILDPEKFALHLGTFFVSKYAHVHKAFITVEQLRWARIAVDGTPHPHAFWRDGDDKRITSVEVDATAGKDKLVGKVTSGISDLLVLKSSGSAFENFYKDEFTTLVPASDRILSTAVDLSYTFAPIALTPPADEKKLDFAVPVDVPGNGVPAGGLVGGPWDGPGVAARARKVTLDVFATDESASVQATLYKMAQQLIAQNTHIASVTYSLPNKHYIPVDMRYLGIDNLTPANAEVFAPVAAPSGLITATVTRIQQ